jgi:rhamnose transport system ATP-binding protein
MAVLPRLTRGGVLRPWLERRLARTFIEQLRIRAYTPGQVVQTLSGGNQQKVVLAKWLAAEPGVLILDEPTRGVDVGAKADVHLTISQLAARGLAIVLISSELPEVLGMSDRIVVLREGRVTAELDRSAATSERVMEAALGAATAA